MRFIWVTRRVSSKNIVKCGRRTLVEKIVFAFARGLPMTSTQFHSISTEEEENGPTAVEDQANFIFHDSAVYLVVPRASADVGARPRIVLLPPNNP